VVGWVETWETQGGKNAISNTYVGRERQAECVRDGVYRLETKKKKKSYRRGRVRVEKKNKGG